MAEKSKKPPRTEQKLHGAPSGVQYFTEEPVPPRRPISASTHLETNPHDQRETLRLVTLLFDDGSVWRQYFHGVTEQICWQLVYEPGDEESDVTRAQSDASLS